MSTWLVILGVLFDSFRRYGLLWMLSKKKPRHADRGRARRQNFPVTDHRLGRGELSTMQLVEKMRQSPIRVFALAA